MHGGNITVKSEHGKGREFKQEFPVKTIDVEEAALEIAADKISIYQVDIEFSDIYYDS